MFVKRVQWLATCLIVPAAVLALCMAGIGADNPARPQAGMESTGMQPSGMTERTGMQPSGAQQPGIESAQQGAFQPRLVDSKPLIGHDVVNQQGEKLGSVKDVVLNSSHDRVAYIAVGTGGTLRIGEKHYAIPWEAFDIQSSSRDKVDKVVLNASKQDFNSAKSFDTSRWPDRADTYWDRFSQQRAGMTGAAAPSGISAAGESAAGTGEMADVKYRRLSELKGVDVKNPQNEKIGDVEDVVLDQREGRPVFAILSFGGVLGMGEKLAAVPWSAMQISPRDGIARLNADKSLLESIAYERKNPVDLSNMNEAQRLYQRFDQQPYWENYGYVAPSGGGAAGGSWDAWRSGSSYMSTFNPSSMVTKEGTITSVGTYRPAENAAPGLRLQITTSDGQSATVFAGPRDYASKQGMSFRYGEKIKVTGSQTQVEGTQGIMATQIQKGDKSLDLMSPQGQPRWSTEGTGGMQQSPQNVPSRLQSTPPQNIPSGQERGMESR